MADLSKLRFNGTDYNVKDASAPKRKFDNTYAKTGNLPITPDDTPQTAIGKLEKQVETNQTNILYNLNMGVKNLLNVPNGSYTTASSSNSTTFSVNNGEMTVTACTTGETRQVEVASITLEAGDYVLANRIFGSFAGDIRLMDNGSSITNGNPATFTLNTTKTLIVRLYTYSTSALNTTIKPMLCTATAYAQSTAYQPPALQNYVLTRLEAEDRAALAEEIDSGAKNKCRLDRTYIVNNNSGGTWSGDSYTVSGVTFAFDFTNCTISCSGTASAAIFLVLNNDIANYKGKEMAISGCPSGGNYDTGYSLYVVDTSETTILKDIGSGATFTVPNNVKRLKISVRSGVNMNSKTFYPMQCTLADWKVSQKFAPYEYPSPKIVATLTKSITSSTTLDYTGLEYTIKANTHYRITAFAKFSSNPLEIAICNAQNSAVFGYAANQDPSGTTMAMLSVVSYVLYGAAIPIAIKAKYKSASTSTVGMIVEEL